MINRFVLELADAFERNGCSVECSLDTLWKEEVFTFDIVYFQWPDYSFSEDRLTNCLPSLLKKRLTLIKRAKVSIVAHCHNLKPHVPSGGLIEELYDIIYGMSDIMVHMGEFSRDYCENKYSNAKHIIVPHHIYSAFKFNFSRDQCCKELNLPIGKKNILCFGVFRTKEERLFVSSLRKYFKKTEFNFVTPGFYCEKVLQRDLLKALRALICTIYYKIRGFRFTKKTLNEITLQKYFCASDIVMIQRSMILNSGNLPLGYAAGKVVIGPDTGNVGVILKQTNNPVYEFGNILSVERALYKALTLEQKGVGLTNRLYAIQNWNSDVVALTLIRLFSHYKKQ